MVLPGPPLPADLPNQVYVSVKALCPGKLHLPHAWVFQDCIDQPESVGSLVPTFSFLISHPTKGRAMFDLGLRKHVEGYPPVIHDDIIATRASCEHDAAEILQSGGVEPADIKTIIYSHLHWDHVGDPAAFTSAEFIVGADAAPLLSAAYPTDPTSTYQAIPATRNITYVRFAESSTPFGPFAHALDLYGDGSLYLVDAPGHIPGHLAAAARVGPGVFVFLAGDCCHNRECYNPGVRAVSKDNHDEVAVARETVERLVTLNKAYDNAVVILAHEKEREQEMPMFPLELDGWAGEEVRKRRETTTQSGPPEDIYEKC